MDKLYVSLDSTILDSGIGKRKLRSIEPDGSLLYDEGPEAKLTETLQRIWSEYPGGMLDISESTLASRDPDAPAVESAVQQPEETEATAKQVDERQINMSFDNMAQLRETILGQLNQSRNELWFVLELASSLSKSASFSSNPPPPPTLLPTAATKPGGKPKPQVNGVNHSKKSVTGAEDLIIPPGTFSTTVSLLPVKPLLTEVLELETALAAKQAALEQCGKMIDSAVDELTSMTAAGNTFWADIKRLKEGTRGRGQWAVVPKPDFGRVADGQKAKDVIIPYAIDEASAPMRARCLAAFDLDPKKKELAFGARTFLRLQVTVVDENGTASSSKWPEKVSEDADVGAKMEEVQMESFDEELFNEIRGEIAKRGNGIIEPRSVQFELGDQTTTFSLVDTSAPPKVSLTHSLDCDSSLAMTRLSFLQSLRARKRRLVAGSVTGPSSRITTVLAPLAQMRQYSRLVDQATDRLQLVQRTLSGAGVECKVLKRYSITSSAKLTQPLTDGSLETVGLTLTLEVRDCPGIMLQVSVPNVLLITTSRSSFAMSDPAELLAIITDDISSQLLTALLPIVRTSAPGMLRTKIYLDEMEEVISLGELGTLSLSISPPFDSVQAKISGRDDAFDGRKGGSLYEWVRSIFTS